MIATIVIGVVCLALIGLLVVRERAHDQERRGLLDRIEAPVASQAAAVARVLPPPPSREDPPPTFLRPTDTDLSINEMLEAI